MIRRLATGLALAALMAPAAMAETFEVKMLNKGTDGAR
ncbi:MAG TPA: pseudoazurin, partial [Rhodobacteraceae bacterium]|nr:pseudoazurin [Paracoccaceae bacterium]